MTTSQTEYITFLENKISKIQSTIDLVTNWSQDQTQDQTTLFMSACKDIRRFLQEKYKG